MEDRLLPMSAFVKLEKNEQRNLMERALSSAGSERKLSRLINVKRGSINDWKLNRCRMSLSSLMTVKQFLNENLVEIPILETSKRKVVDLRNFSLNEKAFWLIGMRIGDRSEDDFSIGITSVDVELIKEFVNINIGLFRLTRRDFWCLITSPKTELKPNEKEKLKREFSEKLGLPESCIQVQPKGTSKAKQINITIRIFNSIIKQFFENIENKLEELIENSSEMGKGALVKGLIDSEGSVKTDGNIEIEMRPISEDILVLASKILKELNIRFTGPKLMERRNMINLRILKPVDNVIKFCNPICQRKRSILMKFVSA